MAGIEKRNKSPGGGLNKVQHGALMSQQSAQLPGAHFGQGHTANLSGQQAHIIQKRPVKLLGKQNIEHTPVVYKEVELVTFFDFIKMIEGCQAFYCLTIINIII